MTTIRDVARLAGVSIGTVSRVLAQNPTVKTPLRDRVQAAIRELEFKPNLAARSLKANLPNVVGLVVPDIANPFFAQLTKAVELEASKIGVSVILANSHDNSAAERDQIEHLLNISPRFLIVVSATETARERLKISVPTVCIDRRYGDYPLIAVDHSDGSASVAEHLFALGHRRVAYFSGPANSEVARLREEGFRRRFLELSANDKEGDLSHFAGGFDYETGETLARPLLSQNERNRPTAIACASDQIAIGVIRTARDLGLSVPFELSVVGFDDIELAHLIVPRLTTLGQPVEALAREAFARVQNQSGGDLVLVPGHLVVRDSTGPAP